MIKLIYHHKIAENIEDIIAFLNETGIPHERIMSISSDAKVWCVIWYEVVEVRDETEEIDFEV